MIVRYQHEVAHRSQFETCQHTGAVPPGLSQRLVGLRLRITWIPDDFPLSQHQSLCAGAHVRSDHEGLAQRQVGAFTRRIHLKVPKTNKRRWTAPSFSQARSAWLSAKAERQRAATVSSATIERWR